MMNALPQQLKEVHHGGFHTSLGARRPFTIGPGSVAE